MFWVLLESIFGGAIVERELQKDASWRRRAVEKNLVRLNLYDGKRQQRKKEKRLQAESSQEPQYKQLGDQLLCHAVYSHS